MSAPERRARRSLAATAGLALLGAWPATGQAHAPIAGLGYFGTGLLHPLITLPHLLALLALGLLLGRQRPPRFGAAMSMFLVAAATGIYATTRMAVPAASMAVVVLCLALGLAVLVSMAAELPLPLRCVLVAVVALVLGLDSGVDEGTRAADALRALAGTWCGLGLWAFILAVYVSFVPPKTWALIGIRVAGSWMAAVGVLMLAFMLRT